jgi:hypothetical protein
MKMTTRPKVGILLVLVLFVAMGLGAAAMVRRSREYGRRAEAAQADMRLYRHSSELAGSTALHHRILSEVPGAEPASAAHAREQAEVSNREKSFFDEQTARAASLRRAYEGLASRPWESEPVSVEQTRRQIREAKHPSFP